LIHTLKCWAEFYDAIACGMKTHEIRKNDRNYQAGDMLLLHRCYQPSGPGPEVHFTGETLLVGVTYVTHGGEWGLPADVCVMSIHTPPLPARKAVRK
jgi:hypothetical protein